MTGTLRSFDKARALREAALGKLAEKPLALDVRDVVSFADVFLIFSGRSDRQVRAIADAVAEAARALGEKPLGVEGYEDGRWVLMDLGDVVVHVFQQEVREHFDLERLWSDAKPIDFGGATDATGAARGSLAG